MHICVGMCVSVGTSPKLYIFYFFLITVLVDILEMSY